VEIAEAHLQVGNERFPIVPLISPLFNGPWIPIPDQVDIEGVLTEDIATEEGNRSSILLRTALDPQNPCTPGAAAQLFASEPKEHFVAYYLAAVGLLGKPVPSACVKPEIAGVLARVLGKRCRFHWASRRCERTLRNLAAEVRGTGKPEEVIAVGAHMDSFPGTVGASDNASGCARLVEFARWFKSNPPSRTVRFLWFTGEELDRRGSRAYVEAHGGDPERICLFVNVDGGVSTEHERPEIAVRDAPAVAKVTEAFAAGVISTGESTPFRQPTRLSQNSDAGPFQAANIPAVFAPGGGKRKTPGPHPHLPTDTAETIEPENLRVASTLALAFIDAIQKHRPTSAPRRPRRRGG